MNGYDLTSRMRRLRRRCPLTASEQALYYELVAICNEEGWEEVFPCSNEELCLALSITENTLHSARQTLVEQGLIYYQSGRSKRKVGRYSFIQAFTTTSIEADVEGEDITNSAVNPTTETPTNAVTHEGVNAITNVGVNISTNERVDGGGNAATNAADYIKTKIKTKTKEKLKGSKSHCDGGASPPLFSTNRKVAENTSAGEKERAVEKEKVEHWPALTRIWIVFVQDRFGEKPSFKGRDPKHFKSILQVLKRRTEEKGGEWTEEKAKDELGWFLQKAFEDEWLRKNFLLTHIEKFMDKVILNYNGTTHFKHPSAKPLPHLVPAGGFGQL